MGGTMSEEFHYLANVGEDQLSLCSSCGKGFNSGLDPKEIHCSNPENCDFVSKSGIEVDEEQSNVILKQ
jgi:prolyl-tRNA synthetase